MECQVCGDSNASKHFGGYCCNACKSFFRRCARDGGTYLCGVDNNCPITEGQKNTCRACRHRRCLAIGMDPLLVRADYVGDKRTRHKRQAASIDVDCDYSLSSSSKACRLSVAESWQQAPDDASSVNSLELVPLSQTARITGTFNSMALGCYSGLLGDLYRQEGHYTPTTLSQYFITVERLCNSFQDTPYGHAMPNDLALRFDLNIPLEQALIEPGALIGRTPMDWSARFVMQSSAFASFWCRSVSYYADWASHVPELQLLEQDDLVKLLVERGVQCLWMCFAHHSIKEGKGRGVCLSGGSYFPLDAAEQASADPEIVPIFKSTCSIVADEIIPSGMEMNVTDGELALLKVLCLCTPVASLSPTAKRIIGEAQNRYQCALVEEVSRVVASATAMDDIGEPSTSLFAGTTSGASQASANSMAVMQRLGRLMMWLSATERVAQSANSHASRMTLFNIASMGGSLPYEFHVQRNSAMNRDAPPM